MPSSLSAATITTPMMAFATFSHSSPAESIRVRGERPATVSISPVVDNCAHPRFSSIAYHRSLLVPTFLSWRMGPASRSICPLLTYSHCVLVLNLVLVLRAISHLYTVPHTFGVTSI